jgi:Multicopper oxidase
MLFTLKNGGSLDSSIITHAVFSSNGAADIIVNNNDTAIDHPYHLHGNAFYLVSRGSGLLTATEYAALTTSSFNTNNPLRRDTVGNFPLLRNGPPDLDSVSISWSSHGARTPSFALSQTTQECGLCTAISAGTWPWGKWPLSLFNLRQSRT